MFTLPMTPTMENVRSGALYDLERGGTTVHEMDAISILISYDAYGRRLHLGGIQV